MIDRPFVSARHAELRALTTDTGERLAVLTDLGSLNGFYVDGRHCKSSVILLDGVRLRIGGLELRYTHAAIAPRLSQTHTELAHVRTQLQVLDYIVLPRTLGSGGFSLVHLAIDLKRGHQVACKIIKGSDRAAVEREVRILRSLDHPNISKLLDFHSTDLAAYLFTPLITGGDLHSMILREGTLPVDVARGYFRQLAYALSYMHSRDVAHLDIKPENLLIEGSRLVLTDFGAAATGRTAVRAGTTDYCAPEALNGHCDGTIADAWSAGVVLCVEDMRR